MNMIYICPTCGKEFDVKEKITFHFLKCWKENNPHYKSKPAPRSEDIITVETNEDMKEFFNSLERNDNNEWNNG